MRIEVDKSYDTLYISEIQETGGILRWEYDRAIKPDLLLLVQSDFGVAPDGDEVAELLNQKSFNIASDEPIILSEHLRCKFSRVAQGRSGVYKVSVAPATYTVYGCKRQDDLIILCVESNEKHYQCDVSATVEYHVDNESESIKKGHIFNRHVETYRFSKIFVTECSGYMDGVLYYSFDDCDIRFPISRKMLGKPFYVRWYQNKKQPIIKSQYEGYNAVKI